VPRSTLRYRIAQRASGRPQQQSMRTSTALPPTIQRAIRNHDEVMDPPGFPLGSQDLSRLARHMAQDSGLKDVAASKGWLRRFKVRFPTLKRRICEPFDSLRASATNSEQVTRYFNLLAYTFGRITELSDGVEPDARRIFNLDEVGFDRMIDSS